MGNFMIGPKRKVLQKRDLEIWERRVINHLAKFTWKPYCTSRADSGDLSIKPYITAEVLDQSGVFHVNGQVNNLIINPMAIQRHLIRLDSDIRKVAYKNVLHIIFSNCLVLLQQVYPKLLGSRGPIFKNIELNKCILGHISDTGIIEENIFDYCGFCKNRVISALGFRFDGYQDIHPCIDSKLRWSVRPGGESRSDEVISYEKGIIEGFDSEGVILTGGKTNA